MVQLFAMAAGPRLLFVVNDATFFLSHRLPLALGAAAAGYEVHVATPEDDAAAGIRAAGLPFHLFPVTRRGTNPAAELRAVGALVRLYRTLRPDIVHHVTAKAILYGGAAARIARVPAVVHAISGLGYVFISRTPRARVLRAAIRASYRVATSHPNCAVIFQNEDDRRAFGRAIRTANVVMIRGSGVDLSRFRRSPLPRDARPIIVLPARMLWDKGLGEFVDAARLARGRGIDARFALVGGVDPGNPAMASPGQLREWADSGVVEWWGMRADMPDVLAQATLVVLPSYREGMPKALLEACAVGRPIVTTDVPGCRDVIDGGEHGVLVPVRDGRALGNAIMGLLADRPRLERMAEAAAQIAPRFAFEHVLSETLAVYRSLGAGSGDLATRDDSATRGSESGL